MKTLFPALVLLLPIGATAQPIEEIEVVGQRLDGLRLEIENTRLNIYDIFNRLNDDDEFDMHCYLRKTTGSLIKEHICVMEFVEDALEEAANASYMGVAVPLANGRVRAGNRAMRDRMVELANANPELQSAILDLEGLMSEYAEATDACETGDC